MTEKEFLLDFIEHAEAMGKLGDNNVLDKFIDDWLEYFHKEYFEVEFIKKEDYDEWKKSLTPIEIASMF